MNLRNVDMGGKGSDARRDVTLVYETVDADGRSCDAGELSDSTRFNLMMVDDDGDMLMNSGKTIQCKGPSRTRKNLKRSIWFQSPVNCAGSDEPEGRFSRGDITATMMGSPGTEEVVGTISLRCQNSPR